MIKQEVKFSRCTSTLKMFCPSSTIYMSLWYLGHWCLRGKRKQGTWGVNHRSFSKVSAGVKAWSLHHCSLFVPLMYWTECLLVITWLWFFNPLTSFSLLFGWFPVGSLLVPCWFPVGSLLVPCWFPVFFRKKWLYTPNCNNVVIKRKIKRKN